MKLQIETHRPINMHIYNYILYFINDTCLILIEILYVQSDLIFYSSNRHSDNVFEKYKLPMLMKSSIRQEEY